jgi:hypothetical protein
VYNSLTLATDLSKTLNGVWVIFSDASRYYYSFLGLRRLPCP